MSRVLIHSLVFSPDGVSTAYIMTDLALELKKLGHSVTVLTTTPHYNIDKDALGRQPMKKCWFGLLYTSECNGVPVWHVKLPMKGKRVWARAFDYLRFHALSLATCLFTIGRQDVVISTSPPLTIGIISWLMGLRWRAPSVYKVAEVYPDLAIRQGVIKGQLMIGAMKWLERLVYDKTAVVVPIAEQFAEVIRGRGVPEQKLRTIPDFVDTSLYRPMPRKNVFAVKHGLLDDFIVLYGGNVGIVQDWESVLFAAEKLSHLPVRFVIVGDGARWKWLSGEIEKRGLKKVTLLGYQPKELMPEINACCDIAIIPMTWAGAQDGFPSKVYTILASAKPVIVSADGSAQMARMITQAGCGRVVPPENPQAFADAVLKAFQERKSLSAQGELGCEFVRRKFSKEVVSKQYDDLIRQLTIL